jgi:hypothetical protein
MGRTTTIYVANGEPLPDVSPLDPSATLQRKRVVEGNLAAIRGYPACAADRKRLVAEKEALSTRLREFKALAKAENTRRNFAGIGSPLHEAIVARFDAAVVAELEADALRRFDERIARKVAKGCKP